MNHRVNAILSDPESNDFVVLNDSSERNMVINLVDWSSAIDLIIGNIISFDDKKTGTDLFLSRLLNV